VTAAISHTFFSHAVVTFAHHGVALPSIFATTAVVIGGAGLSRLPLTTTAFPMSVTYSRGLAWVKWFVKIRNLQEVVLQWQLRVQ